MGSIIGWLVGKTIFGKALTEPIARAIAYAALALLLVGALWGAKCAYDHHIINRYQQKIDHQADAATNQAGTERGTDNTRNTQSDQERHDAIHSVPDAASAGPSHALACKRLRDLGRNPPACGGPQSGH